MIVGVPKEVKSQESRVAITPEGVGEFIGSQRRFSDLLLTRGIEKWRNNAGVRAGFKGFASKRRQRFYTPLTRTTEP